MSGEKLSGEKEEPGEKMEWVLVLLKGKIASEETEPCLRLYKTTEQTSRT